MANFVSLVGLMFGFGGFIEGLDLGQAQAALTEYLIVISIFLVLLGALIGALATDASVSMNTAPANAEEIPPSRGPRFLVGLSRYIVTLLVACVIVSIVLVLAVVPVGHEVQVSRNIDVQFGATNPWTCNAHLTGFGIIVVNWTETTAAGQNYPQITVKVTGPGDSQVFTETTMYNESGNGGVSVTSGSYTFSVMEEPTTDTAVHLSLQFAIFTSGPIWQPPEPVSGCNS